MPKPKIQLKHLERQIQEGTFLIGEQYFREGRVEQLREVDKGLWQANVRMETVYEIEVYLRGERVQEFSCGCSLGIKRLPCPHLIAVLLMLRGFRDQQQEAVRQQREAAMPALQLRTLLHRVSDTDLQQFVRDWAKDEPAFSQALKARFFTRINESDPAHYLAALLHPYQDADGQLDTEPKHLQEIQRLFRQVFAQSRGLLQLGKEAPGFAILEYMAGLLHHVDSVRLRTLLIRSIIQILDEEESQIDLRPDQPRFQFLASFLQNMVQQGEEEAAHQTLIYIQAYAGFPEARTDIRQLIQSLLQSGNPLTINPEPLVLVYYQNLLETDRHSDWLLRLDLPRMAPSFYERLATSLMENGDFEGSQRILETGRAMFPANAELIRLQIQLLWELHHGASILPLAEKLILNNLAEKDVHFVTNYLTTAQLKKLDRALLSALETGQTFEHHRIACIVLHRASSWKALSQRIIHSGSFRLLEHYAEEMVTRLSENYPPLVTRFLEGYLDQHVGPQAKRIIQQVLSLLSQQGLTSAVSDLVHHLKNRYPHRPQLLDETEQSSTNRL
ncbi:MAG: hypothetical protein K9I85_00600 [Saprospiraceae bacterium]|nr:hypothetical protein [Saprospiraceae bacterium]